MITFHSSIHILSLVIVLMGIVTTASANDQPNRFIAPHQVPLTQYIIDVNVNSAKNRLEVREIIQVLNSSKQSFKRLVIDWPHFHEEINISCQDKPVKIVAKGINGLSDSQAMIELPKALERGETIELEIQFGLSLMLENITKLVDWYPHLWWGRNTQSGYKVQIENTPKEYTVATSGVFDDQTKCYMAKGCREFGVVFMKDMKVMEARSGDTAIYSYYDDDSLECVELTHKTAIDVIDFYRDWLGFYPHEILHIVPGGNDYPAGGYPIATAVVGIQGQKRMSDKPKTHWQFITAHEIGHEYWMEHVLEVPNTFWLMIGLGVYADREFMLAKGYGDKHERGMIERYITGVRDLLDTRMNRLPEEMEKVDFDYNNVVVHGKGFSVISSLACVMGKEAFESAYRRCLKEFRGRTLGVADFQRVCEEESGERLDWFFDQWIRTSRFMFYKIISQETSPKNGQYETTVKVQNQGTLTMPVPVTAFFEDGSSQCLFTDRLLDECTLVFISKAPLKEAKMDAKGELPLVISLPDPTVAQLKGMIQDLQWIGDGNKALRIFNDIQNIKKDCTGFYWVKLGLCLFDGKHYAEALQIFKRDIKENPSSFSSLVWQGHVLDLMNRREEALSCYKQAIEMMKPTSMARNDQYGIIIDIDWIKDRLETPFER